MGDSRTALDIDRLPWLEDEEVAPRRRGRRSWAILFAVLLALSLSGISYWLGTRSAAGPDLFTGFTQASTAGGGGQDLQAADRASTQVTVALPIAPADEVPDNGAGLEALATSLTVDARPRTIDSPSAHRAVHSRTSTAAIGRRAPTCGDSTEGGECDDPESAYLATLDRQLETLYSQSWNRSDATKRGLLRRSHELFLARRGSCRSDACKGRAYHARMDEIRDIEAGQWRSQANPVSTAGLAALDKHLSNFYGQSWTRADAGQRAALLRSQDRFVNRLDACRTDSCKSGAYLARMREVSEIMGSREQSSAETQVVSVREN